MKNKTFKLINKYNNKVCHVLNYNELMRMIRAINKNKTFNNSFVSIYDTYKIKVL